MATPNERTLTDMVLVDNEPLNKKKLDLDGAYRWLILTFVLNLTNTATPPTWQRAYEKSSVGHRADSVGAPAPPTGHSSAQNRDPWKKRSEDHDGGIRHQGGETDQEPDRRKLRPSGGSADIASLGPLANPTALPVEPPESRSYLVSKRNRLECCLRGCRV